MIFVKYRQVDKGNRIEFVNRPTYIYRFIRNIPGDLIFSTNDLDQLDNQLDPFHIPHNNNNNNNNLQWI